MPKTLSAIASKRGKERGNAYIRLDEKKQEVINGRVSEDIVLNIGEDERLIGIEILDASKHVNLERLLPVKYEISRKVSL